jgi:uncharacterized protein
MYCPNCKNVVLLMTSRSNVEIDYCPNCRGVWLDKGELDKIIDLSNQNLGPNHNQSNIQTKTVYPNHNQYNEYSNNKNSHHHNHTNNSNPKKPHKKEGWFGEMFDFD